MKRKGKGDNGKEGNDKKSHTNTKFFALEKSAMC